MHRRCASPSISLKAVDDVPFDGVFSCKTNTTVLTILDVITREEGSSGGATEVEVGLGAALGAALIVAVVAAALWRRHVRGLQPHNFADTKRSLVEAGELPDLHDSDAVPYEFHRSQVVTITEVGAGFFGAVFQGELAVNDADVENISRDTQHPRGSSKHKTSARRCGSGLVAPLAELPVELILLKLDQALSERRNGGTSWIRRRPQGRRGMHPMGTEAASEAFVDPIGFRCRFTG